MEAVRIGFILAKLNALLVCAGDVGNAFLYALSREKVMIIAGKEFGPEIQGKHLIIFKALYGTKTASARYHEHMSDTLSKLGWKPSKADPDLWMRKSDHGYEYIARYVDDVIVFAKDPMSVMKLLQETYTMKGVGAPQYYLGGDVLKLGEEWLKEEIDSAFSTETYITNCLPKLAKMLGCEQFARANTPMDENYHAEMDTSELCIPDDISKFRSLIGSANWIIILGRFDIQYAVTTLAKYSLAPRYGHLRAMKRVFGYLRKFHKGKILIDVADPKFENGVQMTTGQTWKEMYPDAIEDIPSDIPEPMGRTIKITAFVDADHARDKVTCRSVTGVLLLLNNTPIQWVSKRQKTVETSTYCSEPVAA